MTSASRKKRTAGKRRTAARAAVHSEQSVGNSDELPPNVLVALFPLAYFFLGGAFPGIALLVGADYFRGWVVTLCWFIGTALLVAQFRSRWDFLRSGIIAVGIFAFFQVLSILVAALASNGALGTDTSGNAAAATQKADVVAIVWLLVGVPHRGFLMGLDRSGHGRARQFVVSLCALSAATLTALYIFLLHLDRGPLSHIDTSALTVGTVFTVALVLPPFRYLAGRCWDKGFQGALSLRASARVTREAAGEIAEGHLLYAERQLRLSREEASRSGSSESA
jgi:hypothetical protein